ncbi:bcl-2-like protein 11 isoform X2 [Conger conger]|nr:bcl-2-like protein 11 isoform X2 [Conger conger]XP_061083862.1 bcl-2-like protein 11 isoform X2 [Conger conger]
MAHSLLGFQSRSPLFRTLSRSSSGYFSFDFDSVPSSPRMTDNKATQTPSPSSQAISHAQRRISDVTQNPQHYEMPQAPPRPFRARSLSLPMDIRPEVWVAQELRRIGDELNHLYLHRGDRNGRARQLDVGRRQNRPAFLVRIGLRVWRWIGRLWILLRPR